MFSKIIKVLAMISGVLGISPLIYAADYTFGVMLPLSGPVINEGTEEMKMINYRLSQINAMGGDQFTAVFEDDRCNIKADSPKPNENNPPPANPEYQGGDFANAQVAYKKLTKIHGVDFILGTVCSGSASRVVDSLAGDGVLMLSAQNSSSILDGRADFYGSLSYRDADIARRLAEIVCSRSAPNDVAIASENVPFTIALRDDFINAMNSIGGCTAKLTSAHNIVFPTGATDLTSVVNALKSSGAEVIFLNPNAGTVIKTLLDALEPEKASNWAGWAQPSPQLVGD